MERKKTILIAFILGLLLGSTATIIRPKLLDTITGFDRRADHGFSRVSLGMSLSQVEEQMGSSGTRTEEFRLGQPGGYEIEYRAAANSGAAYFLYWRTGTDHYYCIGFDRENRVLYKAKGDT